MSSVYLNPPPSAPIPFLEFKGEVASFSYLDSTPNHSDPQFSWFPQDKVEKVLSYDNKPNDPSQVLQSSSPWHQNYMGNGSSHSSNHRYQNKIKIVSNNEQKNPKKWKPSKVRIMQKMMSSSKKIEDHKLQRDFVGQGHKNNSNNNNGIRVCADCHTSTTPLWRSGPQGPKSLCNACGIRQRKARRAAMVAAAESTKLVEEGVESSPSSMSINEAPKFKILDQEKSRGLINHDGSHPLPLKKRGKIIFEGNSQRAFPRDEEEGAILLMALSCGLACSS